MPFCKQLPRLTHLEALYLDDNRIGDEGAAALGEALAESKTLLEVGLSFKELTDTGAQAFTRGLRRNGSLVCLSFGAGERLSDAGLLPLLAACGEHKRLTQLQLSCPFSAGAAKALSQLAREQKRFVSVAVGQEAGDQLEKEMVGGCGRAVSPSLCCRW